MDFKYYIRKSADVKVKDVVSVFPMLGGVIGSLIVHKKYKHTWAISEREDEARDNGYHFFRYATQNHPEQPCIYAIDKNCRDYQKVKDLGPTVQYGSIKHWMLYFSCPYLISSQSFKPNGYMATLIERIGIFRPNHVFLQHGITQNMPDFLLASHRCVKYFIAGAEPEYVFMSDYFGYPKGTIKYTGFARFDALHGYTLKKNRILIMPTWRKWLRLKSEEHSDATMNLASSEYIQCWTDLLKSEKLNHLIEYYNLEVLFYPHPNMKRLMDIESMVGKNVKTAATEDLQELLKSSQLLITDYSSVCFDMFYMKKPVLFYQFDEEKFRKYHYKKGWFDYRNTPFGGYCPELSSLLQNLEKAIVGGYQVTEEFLQEHARVFKLYDQDNCRRIYDLLKADNASI